VPAANAVTWLLSQQNTDDAVGGRRTTSSTCAPLKRYWRWRAPNRRTPQYYAGLNWLQNHTPGNVNHTARRILAVQSNGGSVTGDLQSLQAAQGLAATGTGGWGLAITYQSAALDTALTLQA
jgi:conjugal transfer/entry exclusion protein